MIRCAILFFGAVTMVAGHGNMLVPQPRQSHGETFDDRNRCFAKHPYSNATNPGDYCGLGCLGEACLYYQIGCYAGCPTCSYEGKDLYPTPADLKLADNCEPIAPTIMDKKLRTYNIDGASTHGDWTKVNPWRAPGTTGRGNPAFQPCGVNSGANTKYPLPPAGGQPPFANGTDLPPLSTPAPVWRRGSVQNVSFGIYANHGGGYSYRLCKKDAKGKVTEDCFQNTPLDYASDRTMIEYHDGSRPPFYIAATTTSEGTYPSGSQWRKNPIPMCNCDIGIGCGGKTSQEEKEEIQTKEHVVAAAAAADFFKAAMAGGGKTCEAVPADKCGIKTGYNTCLKCAADATYTCEECCPGLNKVSKDGYTYCIARQKADRCPTGLMFESSWDDGYGSGRLQDHYGTFMFTMQDEIKIPSTLDTGDYMISWRWDCEQTPQVWNSCADISIA